MGINFNYKISYTNLLVVDTLDRGPHFPQLRVIQMTHLLYLLLQP